MEWTYKYSKIMETGHILDGKNTVAMTTKEYGEKIVLAVNAHDELVNEIKYLKNILDTLTKASTLSPTLQKKYDSLWKGIQK